MSTVTAREAFSLVTHPLTGGALRPLADGEAERLGALCATFDPYRRLGQSAGALAGYLRRPVLVKGGAAPRIVHAEDREDFRPFDSDGGETLDLSEIRASVEAVMAPATGGSAAVAQLEASLRPSRASRALEARMKGFEGDSCSSCGNFTLVRSGTCMKCNTCGSTSGCS